MKISTFTLFLYFFSVSEVIEVFKDEGFSLVNTDESLEEKQFAVDRLCSDVLVFPGEYREDLVDHDLFKTGKIVIQVITW